MSILLNNCTNKTTGVSTYILKGDISALTPVVPVAPTIKNITGVLNVSITTNISLVFNHNLNFIPSVIKITTNSAGSDNSYSYIYTCNGIYSNSTNHSVYKGFNAQSGSGSSSSRIIYNDKSSAYISSVTSTTFTLTFESTVVAPNYLSVQLMWSIDYI
jgi:hypothetical protein